MTSFEDTIFKAKEIIDMAGKKTGEIVNIQKLKVNIASVNSQISKDYEAIGRLCYEQLGGEIDNGEAIAEIAKGIAEKYEQIEELRMQIAELRNERICTGCNSPVDNDADFCPRCGKKQ